MHVPPSRPGAATAPRHAQPARCMSAGSDLCLCLRLLLLSMACVSPSQRPMELSPIHCRRRAAVSTLGTWVAPERGRRGASPNVLGAARGGRARTALRGPRQRRESSAPGGAWRAVLAAAGGARSTGRVSPHAQPFGGGIVPQPRQFGDRLIFPPFRDRSPGWRVGAGRLEGASVFPFREDLPLVPRPPQEGTRFAWRVSGEPGRQAVRGVLPTRRFPTFKNGKDQ